MGRSKTVELRIDARRDIIADRLLNNKTYREIAAELDISISTVCLDVKKITEGWRQEYAATYEQKIEAEHQRLLEIDEEARLEWERSKEAKRTKVKRIPAGKDASGKITYKEEVEVTSLIPDGKFLEVRRGISQDIRKLYGLNKPEKHALTDPTGEKEATFKNDVVKELKELPIDKRREIRRLLESNESKGKKSGSGES